MQVILTQEVLGLGDPGEVVTIKNGYGRNYLLPRKMALEATKKNLSTIETERERIARQQDREAEKVKGDADALQGTAVKIMARSGETGKLYGSVTNMDVAAGLAEMGIDIDRRRILMDAPIKSLGEHVLKVKLHPRVVVDIIVTVENSEPIEVKPEPAPEVQTEQPEAEVEAEAAVTEEAPKAEETQPEE